MPATSECLRSQHWELGRASHRFRLVIHGIGMAAIIQLGILLPTASTVAGQAEPCIQMRRPLARISRKQLEIILQLRPGVLWEDVVQSVGIPYCQLAPTLQSPRRDAYPLAFDPSTWLVLEYDRAVMFQRYDFTFHNRQPGGF